MKYKILIVEDEILARLGLRELLNWEQKGFVLLPDATDGKAALRAIRAHEPDIILLDLNIPEIDGLQILRIIKEEEIASQVIIVSCHEEFEMVKEAMKLGAYDYLRKLNLSAKEMENVLGRCIKDRGEGKSVGCSLIETSYEEIMNRDGKNIFSNGQYFQTLSAVLVLGKKETNVYDILMTVKSRLDSMDELCICIHKNEKKCYFLFREEKDLEFYEDIYKEIKADFYDELYWGVSNLKIERLETLTYGVALAEQIAQYAYYDEDGKVVFFDKMIQTKEHSPAGTHSRMEKLKKTISEFAKEETDTILKELIHGIRKEQYISINVLRRIFMDILGFFSMTAQEIGKSIEELCVQESNFHYQRLMQMSNLGEIEVWFLEFNTTYNEKFYVAYKSSKSEILRNVLDYIETHFSEPIHLNKVARIVGMSGAYLSTLFKKEIGYNFIEYVNMRKIEEAKKKLQQGQMVQDVSEILGFENSTYFSKVFKKYAGVTPAYYRQNFSATTLHNK